jgi:hypothetical protein
MNRTILMLTCRTLRGAVLTSAILLVVAWAAELTAQYGWLPTVTTGYLGLVLILAAVAVLGGTFLLSLLPGIARRLDECEH